jgi:hypothetical protein
MKVLVGLSVILASGVPAMAQERDSATGCLICGQSVLNWVRRF